MSAEDHAEKLIEEYDLGETGVDPEADIPSGAATPSSEETRSRAPDGTFLPKEEAPKHPSRLIRMAQDLGLSEEEIAGTPTDQLDDLVYHLNRQALAQAREANKQATLQDKPWTVEAPKETPKPEEDDLEAEFDPKLVNAIKRRDKQLQELQAKLDRLESREAVKEQATVTERIDKVFEKFPQHLGKGKGNELKADSQDYQRRIAVLALAQRDSSSKSMEDKIERAVEMIYGKSESTDEPATLSLRERQRDWENGRLAKPTQRATEEPKGTRKATKTAAKIMRERGLLDDEDMPEDAFPD